MAKLASVGVSTVSKVLNGYSDIAPATRDRVMEAVAELGFTPNRAARSFRTGKTQTASIFMPMLGTEFYDRLIAAMDDELAARDYDAALFPLLNARRLERYRAPDALPYHADGIVFASLNPDWLFTDARLPAPLPAVLIDAYHAAYDTVTIANDRGAFDATTHLLEQPGETFAILIEERFDTPFSSGVFLERGKGFKRALEAKGHTDHTDHVVHVEFSDEGGRLAFREILDRAAPPFNIFASCDLLARGVLDEAARAGLEIGRDVRIVGFDDQPWALAAGLSTVRQPIELMGRMGVKLLLERIADPDKPVTHHELEATLVIRSSSNGNNSA